MKKILLYLISIVFFSLCVIYYFSEEDDSPAIEAIDYESVSSIYVYENENTKELYFDDSTDTLEDALHQVIESEHGVLLDDSFHFAQAGSYLEMTPSSYYIEIIFHDPQEMEIGEQTFLDIYGMLYDTQTGILYLSQDEHIQQGGSFETAIQYKNEENSQRITSAIADFMNE